MQFGLYTLKFIIWGHSLFLKTEISIGARDGEYETVIRQTPCWQWSHQGPASCEIVRRLHCNAEIPTKAEEGKCVWSQIVGNKQ